VFSQERLRLADLAIFRSYSKKAARLTILFVFLQGLLGVSFAQYHGFAQNAACYQMFKEGPDIDPVLWTNFIFQVVTGQLDPTLILGGGSSGDLGPDVERLFEQIRSGPGPSRR